MKSFSNPDSIRYKLIIKKSIADSFHGLWYYFFFMILIYNNATQIAIMPFFEHLIIRNLLKTDITLLIACGYIIRFAIYYIILYLEFAVYIIITEKIYNNKKLTLITITKSVIKRFKNVISFSNWRLFIVFLFVFPFLNIPLTSSILNTINISDTVMHFIKNNFLLHMAGIFTLVFLILLSIKWSYALHYSVIDKIDYKDGIKRSKKILKSTFFPLLILMFMLFGSGVLINQSKRFILDDLIMMNIENLSDGAFLFRLTFIIFSILLSIIIIPFYFTFLTHIYYARKDKDQYYRKISNRPQKRRKIRLILTSLRNISVVILMFMGTFLSFFLFLMIEPSKNKVMVHRAGGFAVTENTAESIKYAVSKDFPAIEIDIMETKDGVFVLSHDKNLKRLTGVDKNIYDLTYDELREIPITINGTHQFITLEECLEIAGEKLTVNIELKVHGNEMPDYLDRLYKIIKEKQKIGTSMVSSFDYDALTYLEKNYPEITTVLISFYVPMPEELVTDGFAVDFAYLTENKAERIRESEKLFIIWTINNDSFKILDALAFNADYIITDSPEILRYIKNTVITFLEEEDI